MCIRDREYGVSWLTELCLHIRLWDYSGYFLNLNGRIYLGGTATFALLGCAFLYYLAPKWNAKFLRLSRHIRMAICLLSAVLFAADIFFSVWSRVS